MTIANIFGQRWNRTDCWNKPGKGEPSPTTRSVERHQGSDPRQHQAGVRPPNHVAASSSEGGFPDDCSEPNRIEPVVAADSRTGFASVLASFLLLAPFIVAGALVQMPSSASLSQLTALSQPKHITMRVGDLDRTIRWYEEKLGFVHLSLPSHDGKTARVLLVGSGNFIEVRRGLGSDLSAALPLRVDDVDAEAAELKQRGVEVVAEPHNAAHRNLRVSIIRDLDGRIIELQQPL